MERFAPYTFGPEKAGLDRVSTRPSNSGLYSALSPSHIWISVPLPFVACKQTIERSFQRILERALDWFSAHAMHQSFRPS